MRWPSSRDYNEAVQDPSFSFKDAELRAAEVTTNAHGLPIARSGGFADVYQLRSLEGKAWAVKCFTKEVSHLHRRYQAISEHLAEARETTKLPFMVDFQYLDGDLRIGSDRYPVLKMAWVEGKLLHDFVREYLDDPSLLEKLSGIWHKLGQNLRSAKMAHGDLQHGNVMLVTTTRGVLPQLIDYDGMYVPALNGLAASEIGHANYQHPGRDADRFHFEMDRFPLLLIYTSIRCLAVGGRKLWEKFDSGDNLLFKEADIKNPQNSALCKELWGLNDPAARALAGWVILAGRMPLREVPLLDDIIGVDGKRTPTLTAKQEAEVRRLLFPGAQPPPLPPRIPEPVPLPEPSRKSDGRIRKFKYAAVGWLILLIAAYGISTLFKKPKPRPDEIAKAPAVTNPAPDPPPKKAATTPKLPVPWRAGVVLKEDAGQVTGVAISADGKRAIVGTAASIQVWDLETGAEIHKFEGVGVTCVALSGDGKRAVAWSVDRLLRYFDVENRKLLGSIDVQTLEVAAVALSADGKRAVCGKSSGDISVWNLETGKAIYALGGHTARVAGVAMTPDGKRAISAGLDNKVVVWNLETGARIRFLEGHIIPVTSVSITPDGKRAISGDRDKIRVWNLETGQSLHEFSGDGTSVVRITADGKWGVSGGWDNTVRLWNLETGKEAQVLNAHTKEVAYVAISADGTRGVSGGVDNTVRLWLGPDVPDLPKPPATVTLTANDVTLKAGETRSVDLQVKRKNTLAGVRVELVDLPPKVTAKPVLVPGSNVTDRIEFVASSDASPGKYTVRLQPSVDGSPIPEPLSISVTILPPAPVVIKPVALKFYPTKIYVAAISGDGKRAVSVSDDTSIRVWDLETNKELHELKGHTGFIRGLAVSHDGTRAVSGGDDARVHVWNLDTGKEIHRFLIGNVVNCVAIVSDGKRVAAGGGKFVHVWKLPSGDQIYLPGNHTDSVSSVAISADGKRVVSASFGNTDSVRVWNLETGKETHQLGDAGQFRGTAISADGKRAVTCPKLSTKVRAWDVDSGKETHLIEGHAGFVTSVSITANGKRAVSNGGDKDGKAACVWDVETGGELYRLEGHPHPVNTVSMSADGKRIVTTDYGGNVYVWNIPTGEAVAGIPPPPDHSKKIVGKWEQIANPGLTYEFTADGKFIMAFETMKLEGTYKFNGDQVEVAINTAAEKLTFTIKKLTDDELILKPVLGENKFRKVKPKGRE